MRIRGRLVLLGSSFLLLLIIGRVATGGFEFILKEFWFTSGFFLLLLLSLIDQPHFSTDANIFNNATTGFVSLLLVVDAQRAGVWRVFLGWTVYLIVTSYALMWWRARQTERGAGTAQIISRINREIGRPEALFSAFLLWGCILRFGSTSIEASALFFFWAVFIILNLPSLAASVDRMFSADAVPVAERVGTLERVLSPNVAEVALSAEAPSDMVGACVEMRTPAGELAATAVVIDDRVVAGRRVGRMAIQRVEQGWMTIAATPGGTVGLNVLPPTSGESVDPPISVVDSGSDIGSIQFHIHPDQELRAGDLLWTSVNGPERTYYQTLSATVFQAGLPEGNSMHSVRVVAGQLGTWDAETCRFSPVAWVARAGQLVHRLSATGAGPASLSAGQAVIGRIPNSNFPVHVSIEDVVTHNTAVVGVTGSGKSYLAFSLVEAMLAAGIKVLILDVSRQHDLYLTRHNPTALRVAGDVAAWFRGESKLAIHQFAAAADGFPKAAADFITAASAEVERFPLQRGENAPARLCVVLEEAHSLIPEWNQVGQKDDVQQVNRTCRVLLQGRKYGMGALVISQRTANVTKTVLNQCNTILALQSFDQTGLDFLRNYMGESYTQTISTMAPRHAILVGKASCSTRPLLVALDDTTARWRTPDEATPDPLSPPPTILSNGGTTNGD